MANFFLRQLEKSLLPNKKVLYPFQFLLFCFWIAPACVISMIGFFLKKEKKGDPLVAFGKNPVWKEALVKAPPIEIGYATCDFQENGPDFHALTNWGKYLEKSKSSLGQFAGLWHPHERDEYIRSLKDSGVKHVRISVSRDKIEPKEGNFDADAIQRTREFIRALIKNGITPMVTLHHFTDPLWFFEKGGWEVGENRKGFIAFAEKICPILFDEGVRKICTFNEPGIMFSQGYFLNNFPPGRGRNLHKGAQAIENMLRAHIAIYEKLKKRLPGLQIGLTHSHVVFKPYSKWNLPGLLLEKIVSHYLSQIYNDAWIHLYHTGNYELRIPFLANCSFSLGQPLPLDFYGMQYYTYPLLKASIRKGIKSVGAHPEETITSYNYRTYPQGLCFALDDVRTLRTPSGAPMPIELTEIGIDIGINSDHNDKERIRYFDRLFQIIQLARSEGIDLRSAYFWTHRDNVEWHKGWDVRFGFYSYDSHTRETKARPAAVWLKNMIKAE